VGWCLSEPQATVAPKAKDKDISGHKKLVVVLSTVPLLCAVQGFPQPIFR
jgi:hypothetical protein